METSIVVHASLKPRGHLTEQPIRLKRTSTSAMSVIDSGTVRVVTTVVHLNEIANLIHHHTTGGLPVAHRVIEDLLQHPNVEVLQVDRSQYERALKEAASKNVDVADALAWVVMTDRGIDEIYTTDQDFRKWGPKIKILPETVEPSQQA